MEVLDGQIDLDGVVTERTGPGAPCRWCGEPIPERSCTGRKTRDDADVCGRKCRQARWRLKRRLATGGLEPSSGSRASGDRSRRARRARESAGRPIRVAYADPPYIGKAELYYGDQPTYAGEVDHQQLVDQLERDYPDGWALSCSVASLAVILPMLPPGDWHLCPWVKQHNPPAGTYGLHTCWETLIVVRGRQVKPGRRDWLMAWPARHGGKLPGRKPIAFCAFLFGALGLVDVDGRPFHPRDELADLFPGTGIVGRAWDSVRAVASDDASPLEDPDDRLPSAA